jgi:hypothetical protein
MKTEAAADLRGAGRCAMAKGEIDVEKVVAVELSHRKHKVTAVRA